MMQEEPMASDNLWLWEQEPGGTPKQEVENRKLAVSGWMFMKNHKD